MTAISDRALAGCRILLIEDECLIAMMVEDILTDLGCEVIGPATCIEEALTIVRTETFDAAIVDVNLNGQKSFPVADALAARGVPWIFSTGHDKKPLKDLYPNSMVVRKPFQKADLTNALQVLLA